MTIDFDDEDYDVEFDECVELPHDVATLEKRVCDLQDTVNELRSAVRDALEAIQEAEDELAEILTNFSPEE